MKPHDNFLHSAVTSRIINAYYAVYNTLGYGFLEKVYQNSMLVELQGHLLKCVPMYSIDVLFKGHKVGYYIADILVNDCVIIEIKAADKLCVAHETQLLNYLKATHVEVGLLLNFGREPEFRRKVFSAHLKK
jgi:GxxExxY protein